MCKKMVHVKRLRKLGHFLINEVPERHFNMAIVCNVSSLNQLLEHQCGTAACAIGWTPAVFPRSFDIDNTFVIHKASKRWDWHAAKFFYGLDDLESRQLFLGRKGHRTPVEVGRNILKFAKRKRDILVKREKRKLMRAS